MLKKDDLLIEKSGGGDNQPVGFVVRYGFDQPSIYSNFMAKMELRKSKAHPIFFKYLHSSLYYQRINVKSIKQTTGIQNLDTTYYLQESVPYPPITEQKMVAKFLDHKTSEIDSLIADKEKLIERLEEYKQSIITEAVTKGLDPNVKMKDSGIEWIGEIPEHWELRQLKHAFKIIYRYPTYYGIEYVDEGIIEIRGEMLKDNGLIDADNNKRYISNLTSEKFPMTKLKEYDLVMSVRGTMGKIGLVTKELENSNITANLLRLSPRHEIVNSKWLLWLMLSEAFNKEMDKYTDKTTIKTIRVPWLIKIDIPVPTIQEQKDISLFLDRKYTEIEDAVNGIKQQIQNLKQYRQSLIYEAVTGKIDVREYEPERSEQLA